MLTNSHDSFNKWYVVLERNLGLMRGFHGREVKQSWPLVKEETAAVSWLKILQKLRKDEACWYPFSLNTHTHSKTVFSLHKLLNGFFERESAISECQKCHFFPPFKLEKVEIFDRQVRVIFIRCKTEKLSPFVQLFIHVCFLASISEYMVCSKGYVYAWSKYLKR